MSTQDPYGVVDHDNSAQKTDYLYRISLKCFIQDARDYVLVVKESGRNWWDLPGGGMDHGENMHDALAREMAEEVNYAGDFTHRVLSVDEPKMLDRSDIWQVRLIFKITPDNMTFSPGEDGDEVAFMHPSEFKNSKRQAERNIWHYYKLVA